MFRSCLVASYFVQALALPQFVGQLISSTTDPVDVQCESRGGQACQAGVSPPQMCPFELSREDVAYPCPTNGCCELNATETYAPDITRVPSTRPCLVACSGSSLNPPQMCPGGRSCPNSGCCLFGNLTPAPFETDVRIGLKILTTDWNGTAFVQALQHDNSLRSLFASYKMLDNRISFYRTRTSRTLEKGFRLLVETDLALMPIQSTEQVSVHTLLTKITALAAANAVLRVPRSAATFQLLSLTTFPPTTTAAPTPKPTPTPKPSDTPKTKLTVAPSTMTPTRSPQALPHDHGQTWAPTSSTCALQVMASSLVLQVVWTLMST